MWWRCDVKHCEPVVITCVSVIFQGGWGGGGGGVGRICPPYRQILCHLMSYIPVLPVFTMTRGDKIGIKLADDAVK